MKITTTRISSYSFAKFHEKFRNLLRSTARIHSIFRDPKIFYEKQSYVLSSIVNYPCFYVSFFFFPPKNFPLSLFHNLLLCQIFLLFLFQNAIQSSLPYQIVSERKFILQQCVSMIHAQNIRLLTSTTSQSLAILSFIFIYSQFPSFASSFFHDPPLHSFPCQSLSRIPVDRCNLRVEETSNFITILSVHVTRAHVLLPVIRVKGLVSR